jgi:lipoprotein NlpI
MTLRLRWISLLWLAVALCAGGLRAADEEAKDDFGRAMAAWRDGKHTNAIAILSDAITASPKEARLLNLRAQMRALLHDDEAAVADLTAALKLEPDSSFLVRERATELFKLGRFTESVADFDRMNELVPKVAPQNWQRGIALYYAGKFAEGRKQFELHQTVNPDDVENAVWHFLCTAREQGLEQARQKLIPIKGDTRVPMKEIHDLFAGKAKPEDVLAAAKADSPSPADLRNQTFYAHLYLGLYFEALGDTAQTREHILAAVPLAMPTDYMGEVARVHARRFLTSNEPKKE